MTYELFYLVGISKETELPKIKTDLKNIVLEEGGVFEEKETEEKRKLSYEVRHETHGIFVAQRFELPEIEKVQTIIRKANLYPNILRFLVSKTEDLPELRTKEERLKGFPQQQQIKEKPIKKTSEPQVRKFEKTESAKEELKKPARDASPARNDVATSGRPSVVGGKEPEEKIDSEDIDKKLEEILNI